MNVTTEFKPLGWLQNPHLQTLWAPLLRKQLIPERYRERLLLDDGDFLDLDWLGNDGQEPLIILLHGLTGSSNSKYIIGAQQQLFHRGWQSVAVNFRGCSGEPNWLPRSYHSGDSEELNSVFKALKKRFPNRSMAAVGFSLGGNMLLKYLGEVRNDSLLDCAVAISVPFQLDLCAERMDKGFSKIYQKKLINELLCQLKYKINFFRAQGMDELANELIVLRGQGKIHNFIQFDHRITAPLHGFSGADDYYKKCSCRYFLKEITTPTLIVHAKDDPFMTAACVPALNELSSDTQLELYDRGGHVGFISGYLFRPQYWLEHRVTAFIEGCF